MNRLKLATVGVCLALVPSAVLAHAPSVLDDAGTDPTEAVVLEDPTLSRAIGATIGTVGEVDWYRMDLAAGDPLVVGMTAPDAQGGIAATFTILGPGLPDVAVADPGVARLAEAAGSEGAIAFEPAAEPQREVHAGLGFIDYGDIRIDAPVDGSYYVAVQAVDPQATGKYVLAPGVREEFGLDTVGGMVDLIDFFGAPWPPESR